MRKRESYIILSILAMLIAVTFFISPVNRSALDKESGSSGITGWEYLASGYRLSEEASLGFESIKEAGGSWTSLDILATGSVVDAEVFWLRGRLPMDLSFYDPVLYLEFDFPVEVYVQGKMIYSYGSLKDVDRVLPFDHMVPVSNEHKGELIYFKYPAKAGLGVDELRHLAAWDMVSKAAKTNELSVYETIPMLLSVIGAFLGICLMITAFFQRNRQREEAGILFYAGLLDFLISVNILSYLYIVQAYIGRPVLMLYTDYISYFLIPYAAGSFLNRMFKSGQKAHIRIINRVFLLYAAVVVLIPWIPGSDITRADYVYNSIFLAYCLYLVYLVMKELSGGNKDLRVVTAGMVIAGVTGVTDIMKQLHLLDYPGVISCYGIFLLTLCMVYYSGLRFFRLYDDVKTANIELTRSKQIIEEINRDLDRKAAEKTYAIRSLFDNAEQGFLSFKEDLKVEKEYSYKCCEIFGGEIYGESVPKLLSGEDPELEKLISTLLHKVFGLKDAGRRDVYFSLLPTEQVINGKLINISYKLIDRRSEESRLTCMLILTDITEKHMLEEKLEQERTWMKMGVKVVTNHNDFVDLVSDYKEFCDSRIREIMDGDLDAGSKYAEVFRAVHTFKGAFAQFEMKNTAGKLHDLETTIDHFIRVGYSIDSLKELLETSELWTWLDEDFDILRKILGDRYLRLDKLVVTEVSKLKEIEGKILSDVEGDAAESLARELRRLRHRPLKEMLGYYPEYCSRLGRRLGKAVADFEIQGDDIAVDPDIYSGLCKAMGHIFRNVVYHGIEPVEERIFHRKSESGNICCSVRSDEGKLQISVEDDGKGIDTDKVRRLAADKCILSIEEAAAASDEEIIQVLFADGFTTAEEVTELSGRGVGLSAVKAEVDKLRGTIEIASEKGKGTSFIITVPLPDSIS